MSCEYGYYTRPNGWKVTKAVGSRETEGHVIRISGPESRVLIQCEHHRPQNGSFRNGRILTEDFEIVGEPGSHGEHDLIHCGLPDVTGSWTAEDNGGDGGEG